MIFRAYTVAVPTNTMYTYRHGVFFFRPSSERRSYTHFCIQIYTYIYIYYEYTTENVLPWLPITGSWYKLLTFTICQIAFRQQLSGFPVIYSALCREPEGCVPIVHVLLYVQKQTDRGLGASLVLRIGGGRVRETDVEEKQNRIQRIYISYVYVYIYII